MEIREGYKKTKIGWIPEDWDVQKLEDIGFFKNGINKSKEDFGQGVPFVNLLDVFGKTSISNTNFGLVLASQKEQGEYNLLKGDVIFVRSSVKPSGVGLTALVEEDLKDTVYSGFLIRFREQGHYLINEFKKYCFYENKFRNRLLAKSSVSANTNINQESLKSLNIIVPPLPEQQKIATILSTVDKKIESIEEQIKQTEQLKKGLMNKLLTEGIGHKDFKDTKIGRIPKSWEVVKLGDISEFKNGKAHEQCIDENGHYIVVNSKFISTDGSICKYSNQNLCPVFLGDILMVMSDVPNGRALAKCFLADKNEKYTLNQRICSIKSIQVNHEFLFHTLNRNKYYLKFDNGVGQTNLKKNEVLECPIALPPTSEQKQIASILSSINNKTDVLNNKKSKYETFKKGLMQQLLTGRMRVKL